MTKALYLKYRPTTWDDVVGQNHIVQTIHNSVSAERMSHAYLFAGPRGTGKTSVARILAKAANCLSDDPGKRPCNECENCQAVNRSSFLDLIEIDAASNTSVEDVRSLRDKINFSPNSGKYKVYIIDEVHMLSTAAFNALLKTLEEPPAHAIFVLATTEVHKIPATVMSRCQRHEFRRIPVNEIVQRLKEIASGEGIEAEEDVYQVIARQAVGGMRDGISLLDQLSAIGGKIDLVRAENILGTATSESVLELISAVIAKDASKGLTIIQRTLDAGSDPRQFARQIVEYLRGAMLVLSGNAVQVDATAETKTKMAEHSQAFSNKELVDIIRVFNEAAGNIRGNWQPSLPLELAFIESISTQGAGPAPTPIMNDSSSKPIKKDSPPTLPTDPQVKASPQVKSSKADNDNWEQLLVMVKKENPITNGLLNSCRTRDYQNGVLTLGYSSDVLRDRMVEDCHKSVVKKAAEEVFGSAIIVECVVNAGGRKQLPPEMDSTGMIATGLRLGGEIVNINRLSKEAD
jgi:DNA polymerase-3 subunit gamma/tau